MAQIIVTQADDTNGVCYLGQASVVVNIKGDLTDQQLKRLEQGIEDTLEWNDLCVCEENKCEKWIQTSDAVEIGMNVLCTTCAKKRKDK